MTEDEKDNIKLIFWPFLGSLEPILCPFSNLFQKWHVTPRFKDIFKTITLAYERGEKRRQIHFLFIFRSSGTHFMPICPFYVHMLG